MRRRGSEWYVPGLRVAAGALGAGALLGAALVGGVFACLGLVAGRPSLDGALGTFFLTGTVAFFVYALGLALLGAPIWAVLHAAGSRGRRAAMLLGAGLSLAVTVVPAAIGAFQSGDPRRLSGAVFGGCVMAAGNAFVGFVIWKIAYRRRSPAGTVEEFA
jgi:hypothetical protein